MNEPIAAVRDLRVGSSTRKVVLLVMADYARKDGSNIYASVSSIAERAELARPTVSRTIAELVSMKVLIQENAAPGRPSNYSINPEIMRGDLSPTVTGTCHPRLQEVSPTMTGEEVRGVTEGDTHLSPTMTGVSPTITGGVTDDDTIPIDPNISQLTSQDIKPELVLIETSLIDVTPDPWYDPEAFPNEDCLASLLGRAIETVPKFSGSASQQACRKIADQLREQFPRGENGEIDQEELLEFLEEWAKFNRQSTKRGGEKDGSASLRNWVRTCEARHRNTKRARERDRGTGGKGLLSGHELAALQFGGGAA